MSKSRDIADSAATINFIDSLTSDAQTQLNSKATLDASPTFTGTVTATAFSGDGSGLTGVDSLPSQTGNNGLFLTTDGSTASWAEAGGGAWELISTTTISGSPSTIDIESDITSSHDSYMVFLQDLDASTNQSFDIRYKKSGSYQSSAYYAMDIADGAVNTRSNQSQFRTGASIDSGGNAMDASFTFMNVHSTDACGQIMYGQGTGNAETSFMIVGSHKLAAAVTGIRFFVQGGVTFTSGKIYVYGLKNSQD